MNLPVGNVTISQRMRWRRRCLAVALLAFTVAGLFREVPLRAQQPAPGTSPKLSLQSPPQAWVAAAVANEVRIIGHEGDFPLQYKMHKVDARGDVIREVIETSGGSVARLVQKNGHPLTAAEDQDERDRLKEVLDSPEDFVRHHKREAPMRDYAIGLVRLMPQAMIFTYAPGQPQPEPGGSHQIAVDFRPDPQFHPPNMIAELLTGLQGRIWIDPESQCVTRAKAQVLHTVNFGWGVLARIYPGGTVELQQADLGGNMWIYSLFGEHLKVREMLLKTQEENTQMRAYDFKLLPRPLSLGDAVTALLSLPVPLR